MSIAAQRAGLLANLRVLQPEWQVLDSVVSQPDPPTVWLLPPNVDYHQAYRDGVTEYAWTVQAFVSLNEGAHLLLDLAMDVSGAGSVKAALEADLTLNGAASSLEVMTCEFMGLRTFNQAEVLLAEWSVTISA